MEADVKGSEFTNLNKIIDEKLAQERKAFNKLIDEKLNERMVNLEGHMRTIMTLLMNTNNTHSEQKHEKNLRI